MVQERAAYRRLTPRVILLGITLIGLVFRAWGLFWGLYNANISARPHPDEWVVYWLFHWFGRTHSLNPCPHPSGQCFFDWGTAYPYAAYPVTAITSPLAAHLPSSILGPHADLHFVAAVLAGRITSLAASTLTILVVYRLGRLTFGTTAGLVAAALLALSTLPIQLAHFATPDAFGSFLVALSLLVCYEAILRPSTARFAAGGALLGVATSTEYNLVLLVIPLVAAWLLAPHRETRWLAVAALAALVAGGILNLYAWLSFDAFLNAMEHSVRIRTVDSALQYQNRFAPYGPDWLYIVRYPLGYGVGAAFTVVMVAGAAWALRWRSRADLLLLAWIIPYALVVSASSAKFMRYSAPLLLPLAVVGARLIVDVVRARRRSLRVAGAAALVCTAVYTGTYDAAYAGLFTSPDPRLVATEWVEQHALQGSPVEFEQLPNGLLNLPYYVTDAGFRPCFSQFQTRHLAGPMRFVMLDDYALEEHPRIGKARVLRFRSVLESDKEYREVKVVHYVPHLLGLRFPIDGSPHDWRYPTHRITIYERVSGVDPPSAVCYEDLHAAQKALYPRSANRPDQAVAASSTSQSAHRRL